MSLSHEITEVEIVEAPFIRPAREPRVNWRDRGETFPARCANSFGRLLLFVSTLESEREPRAEFYARMPRSGRELLERTREAASPTRLFVAIGELVTQVETEVQAAIDKRQAPRESEQLALTLAAPEPQPEQDDELKAAS